MKSEKSILRNQKIMDNAFTISSTILVVVIIFLILFSMFTAEKKTIEGEVTDLESYIVKSGFGSTTEWAIEIDNSTIFKASKTSNPFKVEIGDYVSITYYKNNIYITSIEIIEEG